MADGQAGGIEGSRARVKTSDFDFHLPERLIAQHPPEARDQSRLLVYDRKTGSASHMRFRQITDLLQPGDLLVLNNTRVIPARLRGKKEQSSGAIEMLLVEETALNEWWVLLRPGKRARPGTAIRIHDLAGRPSDIWAEVIEKNEEGHCRIRFHGTGQILNELERLGETPLPPYLGRPADEKEDRPRYQTVYAKAAGSVAAPTAGLHFTEAVLEALRSKGVATAEVTLHVGLGTFAPVKVENVQEHRMHQERFWLNAPTARMINQVKEAGGRIVAAGTTTVRVLETAAARGWPLTALEGKTDIFIYPPFEFKLVDALLTNFHLPKSTLLMLAGAFISPGKIEGRAKLLELYAEAVRAEYRFFSYGDAMLLL